MYNLFRNSSAIEVTGEEAYNLIMNEPDILILDVRTPDEFRDGHIKGAVNIPHSVLAFRLEQIKKYTDKKILVYCQSGGRSPIAVRILEQNGFKNLCHMVKGITAWEYGIEK